MTTATDRGLSDRHLISEQSGCPVVQWLAMLVFCYPHPGEPGEMGTFVWFVACTPAAARRACVERILLYSFLATTEMMRSFFFREFAELELSPQAAERRAQVRLLENVLTLVERRHLQGRVMRWADLPRFAETSAVVETTAAHTDSLPAGNDFGSFDDLKSRRDDTGVVRLR